MNNIDLSVIIVNWKVADLVVQNLKSIFKYTENLNYEIFVVDNNSEDNLSKLLEENFINELNNSKLIFIQNTENLGFAKANNIAFQQAKGKYILFMNPDMELLENSFWKLLNYYESLNKQNRGLLTTKLLFPDKSIQNNIKTNPKFLDQLLILLKLHHFLYKYWPLKQYFCLDFDYSKNQEVEQIMGAFVFASKELLDKLSAWDEDYWIWWEDVDLCKRVLELDKKNYYYAGTAIMHYEGKSFGKELSLKKQKWFVSSLLKYYRKHLRYYEYWKLFFFYIFSGISFFLTILVQLFKIKSKGQAKIIKNK